MKIDPTTLDYKGIHDLMMDCILPRPIAFVSTISENGVFNLAPYSCVSPVSNHPPLVGISIGTYRDSRQKDTLVNIQWSKDFVINVVHEDLAEAMNKASTDWPIDVDESRINIECHLRQIIDVGDAMRRADFVIGQVLLVHVKDGFFMDGEIQMQKLKIIGRMGGEFYCRTQDIFKMKRPYMLK